MSQNSASASAVPRTVRTGSGSTARGANRCRRSSRAAMGSAFSRDEPRSGEVGREGSTGYRPPRTTLGLPVGPSAQAQAPVGGQRRTRSWIASRTPWMTTGHRNTTGVRFAGLSPVQISQDARSSRRRSGGRAGARAEDLRLGQAFCAASTSRRLGGCSSSRGDLRCTASTPSRWRAGKSRPGCPGPGDTTYCRRC